MFENCSRETLTKGDCIKARWPGGWCVGVITSFFDVGCWVIDGTDGYPRCVLFADCEIAKLARAEPDPKCACGQPGTQEHMDDVPRCDECRKPVQAESTAAWKPEVGKECRYMDYGKVIVLAPDPDNSHRYICQHEVARGREWLSISDRDLSTLSTLPPEPPKPDAPAESAAGWKPKAGESIVYTRYPGSLAYYIGPWPLERDTHVVWCHGYGLAHGIKLSDLCPLPPEQPEPDVPASTPDLYAKMKRRLESAVTDGTCHRMNSFELREQLLADLEVYAQEAQ